MKQPVKNREFDKSIFAASATDFNALALELFAYQYTNNTIYRQYCDAISTPIESVNSIAGIPFLPVSFFKTHQVATTEFEAERIFESSGTTNTNNSRHHVKSLDLYRQSFLTCFQKFYGPPEQKCILGLLPSYLERENSSLVFMTEELIRQSKHPLSGFYLYDHEKLHRTIMHNELLKTPTLLIGVTYALLDFAEKFPMELRHTIVMETGGMKGRRQEMTRQEVHTQLQLQFGPGLIHSEYGMTELLSQAYAKGEGIFHCPGWMKVVLRDEDDPFNISTADDAIAKPLTGVINMIDLANMYSCCFIATDDIGRLHGNGSFEVLGRLDNSDIRGCSLMAI